MGSSVSKNISKVATEALARASSDILLQTDLTTDQTQVISVSDVGGDVVISGNEFIQKATINMKALMNALIQENVQQNLTLQIAQAAKSIVSGFNMFQLPNAQNEIDLFVRASIELVNTISQVCTSSVSENYLIDIKRVKGSVRIQNNTVRQFVDIFGSCVQNAVASNAIFQDLQAKLDQSATSKADGLTLWQVAALVAIVLGVPVVSVIGGIAVAGRWMFPISILAGAGCLVVWSSQANTTMADHAFSRFVRNTSDCLGTALGPVLQTLPNSNAAAQSCLSNADCVAFDWQGTVVDDKGTNKVLTPPQTTFYNKVSSICEQAVKSNPDTTRLVRLPIFAKGVGSPQSKASPPADVYLDTATTNYYFFDPPTNMWVKQGTFAHAEWSAAKNQIDWGTITPTVSTPGTPGNIYVYYGSDNPIYFYVYVKTADSWSLYTPTLRGPGLVTDTPATINVSGFKVNQRRQWLLYLGVALIIVGIFGSILAFNSRRPEERK
ncbi:hypothetical protein MIV006R [Invertebrate iridescent virus 3]|uniref:Putative myristoylated protein 006R n=1 Tax=Invertebrate iridescent virus 3 TaxID=345201 RepID=VF118_IIV3|nr:hypothetical protein MIV006R [Invertebrate iridescent virus 3]Q197F4.1 RecName: Full=Putative myristoylated protein 006R [Invertebrate iridescent virus 3]ABF82036.1 hypothetical protein MIV006R [Invertebrate iridescent virus 3]